MSVALTWLALASRGIWHPRYSLLLWVVVTALAGGLLSQSGTRRIAGVATFAYLALALAMTIDQRGFVKGDLNRLRPSACPDLVPTPHADLLVAPYQRTAAEIAAVCAPPMPVVTADVIRHFSFHASQEVAPIRAALPDRGVVDLVTVPVVRSSLATTNADTRALLAERCTSLGRRLLLPTPHLALKRLREPDAAPFRFEVERWICGAIPR